MDLRRCEDRMQGRSPLAADIPAQERVPALPRATTNFRQKVRGDAALPVSDAQRSQLKAGCCRSRWPSPLAAIDPEQKYAWAKGAATNRMFNVRRKGRPQVGEARLWTSP